MSTFKTGKIWLYGLLLLVAIFIVGMVVSLMKAGREVSRVVDKDYYNQGLHYAPGDTGEAAARLGWQALPTVRNGRFELRITDRNGAPVTGGTLSVTVEGPAGPVGSLTCGIDAPGVYCVPLVTTAGGVVKARWLFRRGTDTMSGRMTVLP